MADKRFCTACGAPNNPSNRVCTQCGFRFVPGSPPVAPPRNPRGSNPPVRDALVKPADGPATLPALIGQFLAGLVKNLPKMAKEIIVAAIVSFVLVTLLHAILMVLFPDGAPGTDFPGTVFALAGIQSSPTALLFWFLFAAIFAFIWMQVKTLGAGMFAQKVSAIPAWIAGSVKTAGIAAFPLAMAGVAVALVIRMFFLTPMTSIQFFVLMVGILFSQSQSIAVLAMRLAYSDLNRIVRKTGPVMPAPAFPVSGVLGAAAGFLLVIFFADTMLAIEAAVALLVVGSILAFVMRKRANPGAERPTATAGKSGRSS